MSKELFYVARKFSFEAVLKESNVNTVEIRKERLTLFLPSLTRTCGHWNLRWMKALEIYVQREIE